MSNSHGNIIAGDGSHHSATGTYLTGCTMLETIWGVPCTGNSYQPVAAVLQAVASQVVQARNWSWPRTGGPPVHTALGDKILG